ncbi:hypothetical protein TIFTF001_038865 [Ficus carica]|uniref:Receptor-like serine/threonine-protein kinase n=1 Tax=Ficus carica TaxID=3494 RepID=A0AA88JAR7_FICCA|nr:hypothetical protein TIFTF001_034575 [Ficus carica]GMN69821.1 hypothetical protein TIFTF001_038865 [Ficus carica]
MKLSFAAHIDTITPSQSLIDINKTTLVSSSQIFELGFFSPGKSENRYVGIWYKRTPDVVVWVANRNSPLTDSLGEFLITGDGNLVLLNQKKNVIWSSNSSSRVFVENPVAHLLDTGNLVLRESDSTSSERFLWQSFDYPTDTVLEKMKLVWDLNTGFERFLTSWKSSDDPSTGDYTFKMGNKGLPQLVLAMGSTKKFRSGTWNGVRFSGIPVMWNNDSSSFKYTLVFSENESSYMFESTVVSGVVTRLTLSNSGLLQRFLLEKSSTKWSLMFSRPYDPCDNYGYCGVNGVCRINGNPICDCLEGFTPMSEEDWNVINLSKGCKRKTPLSCKEEEGFLKVEGLKLPDLLEFWLDKSMSLKECEEACLKNCSCTAYANSDIRRGGSGCMMWFGDLIDVREFKVQGSEQPLYVRLSASEMKSIRAANKTNLKAILIASLVSGMFVLVVVFLCVIWRLRRKVRGKGMDEDIELPLFDLAAITLATNNFSPANIIGKGGFGPVYRGNLSTGQEAAIKRLSNESNQGFTEFKNEVNLIAKLQHKNLVALLGCCIQGDERMLIYEYMPNKSLDHFIFGREDDGSEHRRSTILSWRKNFEIVMGVARGLVYLHQDSKLQIVHRDLKASNILLDINMVPKISDFGLARIFDGGEKETTTRRVFGTYGYMPPEYAVEGKFSMKSDVFSFGVLLLETVSGKRNTRFSHPDHHHNLLGHAWLLWNQGKAMELMDARFDKDSIVESQLLRCIHVGLLCVQKFSEDRPPMNSVVLMLANEGGKLPPPKEPGFFMERSSDNVNKGSITENRVTITQLNGR